MSKQNSSNAQTAAETQWVLVPGVSKGEGSGHLVRTLALAEFLPDCSVVIQAERVEELKKAYPALEKFKIITSVHDAHGNHSVFVVDKRMVDTHEIDGMIAKGSIVGVDSVGRGSEKIPFVVDLLPRLAGESGSGAGSLSNLTDFTFNPVPKRRRVAPAGWEKVLITFGGEDAAGLGQILAATKTIHDLLPSSTFDFQLGPLSASNQLRMPERWRLVEPRLNLREYLSDYDLVICSFGLTAFEARAAGCRVILFNPSSYHQRLSESAGFASFGVKKPDVSKFAKLIRGNEGFAVSGKVAGSTEEQGGDAQDHERHQSSGPAGLAELLLSLERLDAVACPACRARGNKVIARFGDRSFYDCTFCGLRYMQLFGKQTIAYNEAYFFDEYKKQYGKTYLDDFEHIKSMGKARVGKISQLVRNKRDLDLQLLDIGCAYGPFLSAAHDMGYKVYGCDINPEAVAYVKNTLGFPAISQDIRKLGPESFGIQFDVVSMWYVIEHFPDLHAVLPALNRLLKKGGIIAMSTPSGEGVSARFRPSAFLDNSPRDHYSIWMPSRINTMLATFGFALRKVFSTGHHPERFPGFLGRAVFRTTGNLVSRIFKLGDTFELYAEKVNEYS